MLAAIERPDRLTIRVVAEMWADECTECAVCQDTNEVFAFAGSINCEGFNSEAAVAGSV
jgi:hypothetical protein